jgi:flagellin
MPLVINTNIASMEAQRNLGKTQMTLSTSFNRLSSGLRINSAKDDAAGLAISENMRMQIRSYTVVERNANDGISMAQTAEGALGQISDVLGRLRELAAQGANGSLSTSDRDYLQTEFTSLKSEIARLMTSTKFNGVQLIGAASTTIDFQVGINNVAEDRIAMTFGALALSSLLSNTTRVSGTAGNSRSALDVIDGALTRITTARARYGAFMNRLEITTANLQTMRLNVSSAASRIRDVDVAEESANLARQQVLSQAGASILAQANQLPQNALGLLKG